MKFLRSLFVMVAMLAGVTLTSVAGVTVHTDLDAAKKLAAKEGKQLMVEFSGRTWCPPCKALVKDVIPSKEFATFAATRVIVHLDYPRKSERTQQHVAASPELAQRMAWHAEYNIEGFPTVVLLDVGGKEIGRVLGYDAAAGAAAFLAELTGSE